VGDEGEPGPPYFPSHVFKEALAGLAVTAVLFGLAAVWRAPLEALAEPSDTGYDPRPDWYFLGLFQLLKVFQGPLEPLGTVYLPNLLIVLLILLPFVDRTPHRHWRRRPVTTALGGLVVLSAAALTVAGAIDAPDNDPTFRHELGLTPAERQGYLLVRRHKCISCHALEVDGHRIGGSEDHPDAPYLDKIDQEPDVLARILEDPREALSEETEMPDFAHVPYEQRRAMGLYLQTLQR
jgi:ubiquinol-cytochrome c reductase cytochrome b subunit